mmetsp:Transcript_10243/g.11807  ORF Transcript_10243/g.11807 Transcript_10243/m.11807 type:complete len:421 (-) Transcript_10243:1628-2890(-)
MSSTDLTSLIGHSAFVASALACLLAVRSRKKEEMSGPRKVKIKALGKPHKRIPLSDFPPLQNDLILRQAMGEKCERVPIWMMRQAGRYLPEFREERKHTDFFTMCRTPELSCKVSLQPLERFPTLDAVIIFQDILIVPQAMGMEVLMVKGKGPVFPEPLRTPSDLERLDFSPDMEETLGYVFDSVNLTRQRIAGKVPLLGFSGAPFTLMGYMVEGGGSKTMSKVKTWLFRYPDESHRLLQGLADIIVEYMIEKVRAGAQMLQIFESNGGDLSPAQFEEFSLPYLAQIAKRIKKGLAEKGLPVVPLTVFARGANWEGALEKLSETEYNTVSLDWRVDPKTARNRISVKNATIQGNLDPCTLYASKDRIYTEVVKMLKGFGTERYIANLGHGMHPDHDPEHAHAFILAVQEVSTKLNAGQKL